MKCWAIPVAATLVLMNAPAWADEKASCGGYGTPVEFLSSPKEAAKWALKEEKLVLVLHVSGVFEDPGLT